MARVTVHPEGGVLIGERHVLDDFAEAPAQSWKCNNCDSQWHSYRLDNRIRYRLLHKDETCVCFGKHCACAEEAAA